MDPEVDAPTADAGDSVEQFVADLVELRRAEGNVGFKALARRMDLSHGTVHNALANSNRLPTEYVVAKMIGHWRPSDVDQWVARRSRLAASSEPTTPAPASDPVEDTGGDTSPRVMGGLIGSPPRRAIYRAGFGAFLLVAGLLVATPLPRGGVDVDRYCRRNVPQKSADPAYVSDGTWSGWRCRDDDGREVVVDMNLACQQQRVPPLAWGRTFADHIDDRAVSWRCYTSLIHPVVERG